MRTARSLAFVTVLVAWLTAGCSGPSVRVGMSANANLNLDPHSQPLPVVVRIYQLADDRAFLEASFAELWKKDMIMLGDSLLTRTEVVVYPSTQDRIEFERHDQARFVAAAAIFRNPAPDRWRAVYPLPDGMLRGRLSSRLSLRLVGSTLQLGD